MNTTASLSNVPRSIGGGITSLLGPANRARLGAVSKDWHTTSLVTPQESKNGAFEHNLKKILVEASRIIKHHMRTVAAGTSRRHVLNVRIGGAGPGIRAHILGGRYDDQEMEVAGDDVAEYQVKVEMEYKHIRRRWSVDTYWDKHGNIEDYSIEDGHGHDSDLKNYAKKALQNAGWVLPAW